jgi:hypothetical protein
MSEKLPSPPVTLISSSRSSANCMAAKLAPKNEENWMEISKTWIPTDDGGFLVDQLLGRLDRRHEAVVAS